MASQHTYFMYVRVVLESRTVRQGRRGMERLLKHPHKRRIVRPGDGRSVVFIDPPPPRYTALTPYSVFDYTA